MSAKVHPLKLVRLFCLLALSCDGIDTGRWHGRSIYFVVTDRFAKETNALDELTPCQGRPWCGGTLRGVSSKLDYIQKMGFDAIWITPVVEQVDWLDNWNGTGYHGYWARDFFKIDLHLGTEDDLVALKKDCEKRGMLLMVDIVANHVGPIHSVAQIQQLGAGLNSPSGENFHQLDRKPGQSLESYIQHPRTEREAGTGCWPMYNFGKDCNYTVILDGWFGDLADLNQENPETRDYLLRWIQFMVNKYDMDGFRLDTALYIPKWFLDEFQKAADVYMIGEVVTKNMSVHHSFTPHLTGLLNFPVTIHLGDVFRPNGSMVELQRVLSEQNSMGYPDLHLLGNFVDNHDGDRFLYSHSGSICQLKNALAWTMLYHGLPIVYYGTEQVEISNQKDSRVSMWPHFGDTDISAFLAQLNKLRKDYGLAAGGEDATAEAVVVAVSEKHLAFSRANLLILVSNMGEGNSTRTCMPTSSLPSPWGSACQGAVVTTVLGHAPQPSCPRHGSQSELCIETDDGGLPSVFAISDEGPAVFA